MLSTVVARHARCQGDTAIFEDVFADYNIFEDGKEFVNPAKPTLAEKRKIGKSSQWDTLVRIPAATKMLVATRLGNLYESLEEIQFSYSELIILWTRFLLTENILKVAATSGAAVTVTRRLIHTVYFLCVFKKRPGFFELGYFVDNKTFRYIYIQPLLHGLCAGVVYKGEHITAIVSEFKKNPRKLYAWEIEEKEST